MNLLTENLRRLRLARGYTQEQLAEKLGISSQSISRWECGTTLPDVMLLPKLARLYGITVDELYREEPNAYANYAQRLLAVYESTGRAEDFLAAEQEFHRLLGGEYTADDLRCCGVLYHYMAKRCAVRALHYLERAISEADRQSWIYTSAAQQKTVLMQELGRGQEEIAHYDRELAQNPADPLAWRLCIAAHHITGNNGHALHMVTQALEKFPEETALFVLAGDICKALGQYEAALSHWSQALHQDPEFRDAAYSMGQCLEELCQFEKALRIWEDLHKHLLSRGYTQETQFTATRIQACRDQL